MYSFFVADCGGTGMCTKWRKTMRPKKPKILKNTRFGKGGKHAKRH
jgi:hypothetical protein